MGGTIGTIGFFDGLHRGHCFLLDKLMSMAKEKEYSSMVITFKNNPLNFFCKDNHIKQLMTIEEKEDYLTRIGVDKYVVLDFDDNIAVQKAEEFLQSIRDKYSLKTILIGYDHTFGSDKIKDFSHIKAVCEKIGVEAIKVDKFGGELEISSSVIREYIKTSNMVEANKLLGYDYFLRGVVVEGHKLGRTIGFPTANMQISSQKLLPKNGVYAVKVELDSSIYHGMLNIGKRPTVDGHGITIEVNIFDFNKDIYGKTIKVSIEEYIREEVKFDSLESLKNQLFDDREKSLKILKRI